MLIKMVYDCRPLELPYTSSSYTPHEVHGRLKCYMIAHAQLHASLLECLVLLLTIHDRGLVAAAAQERVLSGNLFIMLVLHTVIYDSTSPPWLARPISLSLSLSLSRSLSLLRRRSASGPRADGSPAE